MTRKVTAYVSDERLLLHLYTYRLFSKGKAHQFCINTAQRSSQLECARPGKVKGWAGTSPPCPYIRNSKKRHSAPSTPKICIAVERHRSRPRAEGQTSCGTYIDPRYNWGERLFLSFRVVPRLLPTLSLLRCYKQCT